MSNETEDKNNSGKGKAIAMILGVLVVALVLAGVAIKYFPG